MKLEIDVPDEVIEKIEHMIALEIVAETSFKEYLVASVVEATRCTLESCSVELPRNWPEPKTPA